MVPRGGETPAAAPALLRSGWVAKAPSLLALSVSQEQGEAALKDLCLEVWFALGQRWWHLLLQSGGRGRRRRMRPSSPTFSAAEVAVAESPFLK